MKTTLISFSFNRGGAAIAAQKFARMASQFSDVNCYCAEESSVENVSVSSPSKFESYMHLTKRLFGFMLLQLMSDGNSVKHSLNLFSSDNVLDGIRKKKETRNCALNIHWFNNDTLSIWRLGSLPKATVITLHDEWLYCGAEHYYSIRDNENEQFKSGYKYRNKELNGVNWNYIIWKIKYMRLNKRNDLIITVPSTWIMDRAKSSAILQGNDIHLLPNPIETKVFYKLDSKSIYTIRQNWDISSKAIVIAFGAIDGEKNYLKGGHLLREALTYLKSQISDEYIKRVKVVLFGGNNDECMCYEGFPAINLGRITTTIAMREIYNAADFVVVPSMVESFGQVAAESLACETPVVAFAYSGLLDIVQDEKHGYLAKPYDSKCLSYCVAKMIQLSDVQRAEQGRAGRKHVIENFSTEVVSVIYKKILEKSLME